jgi:hypothetical protein
LYFVFVLLKLIVMKVERDEVTSANESAILNTTGSSMPLSSLTTTATSTVSTPTSRAPTANTNAPMTQATHAATAVSAPTATTITPTTPAATVSPTATTSAPSTGVTNEEAYSILNPDKFNADPAEVDVDIAIDCSNDWKFMEMAEFIKYLTPKASTQNDQKPSTSPPSAPVATYSLPPSKTSWSLEDIIAL